jgi:hypothetical protein
MADLIYYVNVDAAYTPANVDSNTAFTAADEIVAAKVSDARSAFPHHKILGIAIREIESRIDVIWDQNSN